MKVALLPTGGTELRGMGRALGRLFPDHAFYCVPDPSESGSTGRESPYPGFTSLRLSSSHQARPPGSACDLVARAAQEALGDRHRPAADLVVIVDDLELYNTDQPAHVVAVMRSAVEQHLGGLRQWIGIHTRTRDSLLAKVSFHLVVPMIEAWFFADDAALQRAGVPADAPVYFSLATDPESFVTADVAYLAATAACCPALSALPPSKQKAHRPEWMGTLPRDRHPKGYLQWLCRAPGTRTCTTYSETGGGSSALESIRWQDLFGREGAHFQFLRALVEDLEDGLGGPSSVGRMNGTVSPLTSRSRGPRNPLLRNI